MDAKIKAGYEARAAIIKAMGHPTRLYIVDLLAQKSLCVAELTDLIGADMSTVSKHLSVLKAAGIIDDDKRGAHVYYSLKTPCVMNFFGCVEKVLKSSAVQQLRVIER
jgi:DNA-binding transcriptional ArsR family regulator